MFGLDDTRVVFWFSRDLVDPTEAQLHRLAETIVDKNERLGGYSYQWVYSRTNQVGIMFDRLPYESYVLTDDMKWLGPRGVQ